MPYLAVYSEGTAVQVDQVTVPRLSRGTTAINTAILFGIGCQELSQNIRGSTNSLCYKEKP